MAKIFEDRATIVREQVAIKCDRCGAVHDDEFDTQEYLSWQATCGYGNHTFGDMNRVSIDLCQNCVKAVLGPWIRVTTHAEFCRALDEAEAQGIEIEDGSGKE